MATAIGASTSSSPPRLLDAGHVGGGAEAWRCGSPPGATPRRPDHVLHALAAGCPFILHLDRSGADANRAPSIGGIPTRPGYDHNECAPAVSREGGANADVRYVHSRRGRGGRRASERYCDGQRSRLRIIG
jgi:hypothetical protein